MLFEPAVINLSSVLVSLINSKSYYFYSSLYLNLSEIKVIEPFKYS